MRAIPQTRHPLSNSLSGISSAVERLAWNQEARWAAHRSQTIFQLNNTPMYSKSRENRLKSGTVRGQDSSWVLHLRTPKAEGAVREAVQWRCKTSRRYTCPCTPKAERPVLKIGQCRGRNDQGHFRD